MSPRPANVESQPFVFSLCAAPHFVLFLFFMLLFSFDQSVQAHDLLPSDRTARGPRHGLSGAPERRRVGPEGAHVVLLRLAGLQGLRMPEHGDSLHYLDLFQQQRLGHDSAAIRPRPGPTASRADGLPPSAAPPHSPLHAVLATSLATSLPLPPSLSLPLYSSLPDYSTRPSRAVQLACISLVSRAPLLQHFTVAPLVN